MKKQLKKLKIITHPNPILRETSKPVNLDKVDKKTTELIERMIFTMELDAGIGIAAPQVGKKIRLIIISFKSGPMAMFNPEIKKISPKTELGEEGCLSLPKVFGNVRRSVSLECEYYDIKKTKYVLKASGLLARVIQHEIDHLNGVLFIDKAIDIIKPALQES